MFKMLTEHCFSCTLSNPRTGPLVYKVEQFDEYDAKINGKTIMTQFLERL